jgi:hypothetical protein
MSQQQRFQDVWYVKPGKKVSPLRVRVPAARPASSEPKRSLDYVRFDVRQAGIIGRLAMRPVLRIELAAGNIEKCVTVSESHKWATQKTSIKVTEASMNAYRWYRLSRSVGPLVSGVASLVGALLIALGALEPKGSLGQVLLIAGGALTLVAAGVLVLSAWRAPIE